jgi:hypothetical protein
MLLSLNQNARQSHDINTANRSFENVAQDKYFGATVTNLNLIQEEIKTRLNMGNVCYHSVHNLLSSCLLYKNVKMRITKFPDENIWTEEGQIDRRLQKTA